MVKYLGDLRGVWYLWENSIFIAIEIDRCLRYVSQGEGDQTEFVKP